MVLYASYNMSSGWQLNDCYRYSTVNYFGTYGKVIDITEIQYSCIHFFSAFSTRLNYFTKLMLYYIKATDKRNVFFFLSFKMDLKNNYYTNNYYLYYLLQLWIIFC